MSRSCRLTFRLRDCEPPIWRTLLVRGAATLHQLHMVIQPAMAWTNSHLYEFKVEGEHYTDPETLDGFDHEFQRDTRDTRLSRLGLEPGKTFTHLFGDHCLIGQRRQYPAVAKMAANKGESCAPSYALLASRFFSRLAPQFSTHRLSNSRWGNSFWLAPVTSC